jgi:hypothetical protein
MFPVISQSQSRIWQKRSRDHFWGRFSISEAPLRPKGRTYQSRAYILGDKAFRLSANHRVGFDKRGYVTIFGVVFKFRRLICGRKAAHISRGHIFWEIKLSGYQPITGRIWQKRSRDHFWGRFSTWKLICGRKAAHISLEGLYFGR